MNGKCELLLPALAAISHWPEPLSAVTVLPFTGHKSGVYDLKVTGAPDADVAENVMTWRYEIFPGIFSFASTPSIFTDKVSATEGIIGAVTVVGTALKENGTN